MHPNNDTNTGRDVDATADADATDRPFRDGLVAVYNTGKRDITHLFVPPPAAATKVVDGIMIASVCGYVTEPPAVIEDAEPLDDAEAEAAAADADAEDVDEICSYCLSVWRSVEKTIAELVTTQGDARPMAIAARSQIEKNRLRERVTADDDYDWTKHHVFANRHRPRDTSSNNPNTNTNNSDSS